MMEKGACLHELGAGEVHDVSKDKRILKTSDLKPEDEQDEDSCDSDTISELKYTQDSMNMLKIRMSLRLKNSSRQFKNITLSCEIKSLRQTLDDSSRLVEELDGVHRACREMDATIRSQGNWIRKMKQENNDLKAKIENKNWEKSMIIEDLIFCNDEHVLTIEELRTNIKTLEVQMEKAMMFGGAHMDQLPHLYDKEAREQEHSMDLIQEEEESPVPGGGHVRIKSWWRRQANKVGKAMGTFRLSFKCCLGVRVFKRNRVHPINSDVL